MVVTLKCLIILGIVRSIVNLLTFLRMCEASVKQDVDVFAVAVLAEVLITMFTCLVAFIILLVPCRGTGGQELDNITQEKKGGKTERKRRRKEIGNNAR